MHRMRTGVVRSHCCCAGVIGAEKSITTGASARQGVPGVKVPPFKRFATGTWSMSSVIRNAGCSHAANSAASVEPRHACRTTSMNLPPTCQPRSHDMQVLQGFDGRCSGRYHALA